MKSVRQRVYDDIVFEIVQTMDSCYGYLWADLIRLESYEDLRMALQEYFQQEYYWDC